MALADLWLPSFFGDNMIFQADVPAVIWGQTWPGQKVSVELAGRRGRATARARGDFRIQLPPLKAGGPHTLAIRAQKDTRVFENVLAGDVWFCSGQSNMAMSVGRSANAENEIAAAKYPRIRFFSVANSAAVTPLDDVSGHWAACDPQSVVDFSAAAYFFGREVHRRLARPVGLINSSWGGTKVEPWISPAGLQKYSGFRRLARTLREYFAPARAADQDAFHRDRCNRGAGLGWADPEDRSPGWKTFQLPGIWTDRGLEKVGAFWFRRAANIPANWRGQDLYLSLGAIVDFDTTYFNGVKVGGIGLETRGFWEAPRKYLVPAALVRPGRNVIAVRVFAHNRNAGFVGPREAMRLSVVNKPGLGTLNLAGEWRYRVECALPRKRPLSQGQVPGTLFNAMVSAFTAFPIRGFLWYQGESNIHDPYGYRELFPLLIADWRTQWGRNDLPFYYVQIPDYGKAELNDKSALLREAQFRALQAGRAGMAVIADGGEKNVHPMNKQLVGERLARLALAHTYGRKVEASGPLYRGCRIEGRRLRVSFNCVARGLRTSDGRAPAEFLIAGADRRFLPAQARIEGSSVVVWRGGLAKPWAVRYAWSATPRCTLCNSAGLPASPFRTDDWPVALG